MNNIVEIHYSKNFAYFAVLFLTGLISLMTYIIMTGDPTNRKGIALIYLSAIGILLLALIFYLTVKYLIPAVKGHNAIILNSDFIIDNIRNNKISWNNVREIRSINGRANFIAIDLIDNSEVTHQTKSIFKKLLYANNKLIYGTPILIPTQFVNGTNKELMNLFLPFFQRTRTACNK